MYANLTGKICYQWTGSWCGLLPLVILIVMLTIILLPSLHECIPKQYIQDLFIAVKLTMALFSDQNQISGAHIHLSMLVLELWSCFYVYQEYLKDEERKKSHLLFLIIIKESQTSNCVHNYTVCACTGYNTVAALFRQDKFWEKLTTICESIII